MNSMTRRDWLKGVAAAGAMMANGASSAPGENAENVRTFHASLSTDAVKNDPLLLETVRDAGVSDVWLSCFFQGVWHNSIDELRACQQQVEKLGMRVHNITVPLGHPTFTETLPDYMPRLGSTAWKRGVRPDGRTYGGVSIHEPATSANAAALRQIKTTNPKMIFLDDDFRLAPSPADIGGCFCDEHKARFLQKHGFGPKEWEDLLGAVEHRELTPVVRAWLEDACDELTASFRAQQEAAAPEAQLGIMVMYLGSEKAGIRLKDYGDVPFRVGELMFDDTSFGPVKGKTNELFSALFHRGFARPELAFSETTAWPPDGLSAANMAAKLAVSTLSDVRNTMFMSGITPFPRSHWPVLAPAMRKNAELHRQVAGHKPRGPFKHYWGDASRWVGDDNSYSLFLALGVPFEPVEELPGGPGPPGDGWTFLSDFDARSLAAKSPGAGGSVVCRPSAGISKEGARAIPESLPELFAFKREIAGSLRDTPFVEEDTPIVCGWYPTANVVLLWNLEEDGRKVTLRYRDARQTVALEPLGIEWARVAPAG